MKKILYLLVCCPLFANAVAPVRDTVVVVRHPNEVVLEEKDNKVILNIKGRVEEKELYNVDDSTYRFNYEHCCTQGESFVEQKASEWNFEGLLGKTFSPKNEATAKKKKTYSSLQIGGIGVGFVTALNAPKNMKVDMAASKEIFFDALTYKKAYDYGRHKLSIGLGFHWRNYRMTGDQRFIKDASKISIEGYPTNSEIDFSRIKVFSVTFPLQYEFCFHKDFSLSAAAILNINTHASVLTRYTVDGEKKREFTANIHHTPVSVDLRGAVSWKSLGVYVKYSPCKVLNTSYGPDFSGLSTGVTFGF